MSVWDKPPSPCLQWDFDPDRLEGAAGQLAGQPILVGGSPERPADEVISFSLWPDPPTGGWMDFGRIHGPGNRVIILEVANILTKETATSVLHLFHHLGNDTFLSVLSSNSLYYLGRRGQVGSQLFLVSDGSHLNPAIFTALRQARGGRMLEFYTHRRAMSLTGNDVFGEVLRDVRIHTGMLDT